MTADPALSCHRGGFYSLRSHQGLRARWCRPQQFQTMGVLQGCSEWPLLGSGPVHRVGVGAGVVTDLAQHGTSRGGGGDAGVTESQSASVIDRVGTVCRVMRGDVWGFGKGASFGGVCGLFRECLGSSVV